MIPVSTAADGGWEEGVGPAIGGLRICLAVSCDHDIGEKAGVGGAHGVGEEADVGGCGQQIVLPRWPAWCGGGQSRLVVAISAQEALWLATGGCVWHFCFDETAGLVALVCSVGVCNKEQLYALVDAEAGIFLIYSLF
jgi:hypothetical protein